MSARHTSVYLCFLAAVGGALALLTAPVAARDILSPANGYLKAHKHENPQQLLGGTLKINISQDGGLVFVGLPDQRLLDPHVFGTPDQPRGDGGTPGITGLPAMARGVSNGNFTLMKPPSPFGDAYFTMDAVSLQIEAVDATATDAATTEDKVRMSASWSDENGNTYTVRCCGMMIAHGLESPTFGGVMTNHITHGFTRVGTPLMPSMFTYFAFWGMGEIMVNDEVVDGPRLIHGMLTEYVRTEGYQLGFDEDVDPTRVHFHVITPPFRPVLAEGKFAPKPVNTGFELPNGKMLPFWHVMFEDVVISGTRG